MDGFKSISISDVVLLISNPAVEVNSSNDKTFFYQYFRHEKALDRKCTNILYRRFKCQLNK